MLDRSERMAFALFIAIGAVAVYVTFWM